MQDSHNFLIHFGLNLCETFTYRSFNVHMYCFTLYPVLSLLAFNKMMFVTILLGSDYVVSMLLAYKYVPVVLYYLDFLYFVIFSLLFHLII